MSDAFKALRFINPRHGVAVRMSPMVRRLIAPNQGPFTYSGTGTYLIGDEQLAVIDPGPDDPDHIDAILHAVGAARVSHILITHTHRDHSPGARLLQERTGAPCYGLGRHGTAARDDLPAGLVGGAGEEGADVDFVPDHHLADGDEIRGGGWTLKALWTPGHTSNHLCFALMAENAIFTGDHIMGWSTSVISPPDGDMGRYMRSLHLIKDCNAAILWPTHGPPVLQPRAHISGLIQHRIDREKGIIGYVENKPCGVEEIVAGLYADLDPRLYPAAQRSVLAHLVDLADRKIIKFEGLFDQSGRFFV
ncbi:MBL fold metallo-hydrolase [Iodidimonas nitroreducens]|uniref:MBL fold metallo-hydrolase n=1 Tax=Iodidimonas nitroreducens TaxID=1236968 RepID=A0A5A7N8K9_9PROT|nr:MBL fold metallo-hydrolase [Iodidimonas nitroreducens]GAK33571.1 beta-lactamase-like protein 2 [alpha proteobacterium Q-1]GER03740.1 MBL fold metallo-hydrolase [Iodidimonas nitroreducens]